MFFHTVLSDKSVLFLFCRTLGLVFQSENFSYNHYNNYIMDSWSYLNNPVPEPNHPKHRLHPADNFAALTMLQEHCKVNTVDSGLLLNQTYSTLATSLISPASMCVSATFSEPEGAERRQLRSHQQHLQTSREVSPQLGKISHL